MKKLGADETLKVELSRTEVATILRAFRDLDMLEGKVYVDNLDQRYHKHVPCLTKKERWVLCEKLENPFKWPVHFLYDSLFPLELELRDKRQKAKKAAR